MTKNKPSFTGDDSLRKMLHLAAKNITAHWNATCRNWDMASNYLRTLFEEEVAGYALFDKRQCAQRRGIFSLGKPFFRGNPGWISRKNGAAQRKKTRRLGMLPFIKQGQVVSPDDNIPGGCERHFMNLKKLAGYLSDSPLFYRYAAITVMYMCLPETKMERLMFLRVN